MHFIHFNKDEQQQIKNWGEYTEKCNEKSDKKYEKFHFLSSSWAFFPIRNRIYRR